MVRLTGIEPVAFPMSKGRSAGELKAQLVLPEGLEPPIVGV